MPEDRSEVSHLMRAKAPTTTKVPRLASRRPSIAHIWGKRMKKRTHVCVSGLSHCTVRTSPQATTRYAVPQPTAFWTRPRRASTAYARTTPSRQATSTPRPYRPGGSTRTMTIAVPQTTAKTRCQNTSWLRHIRERSSREDRRRCSCGPSSSSGSQTVPRLYQRKVRTHRTSPTTAHSARTSAVRPGSHAAGHLADRHRLGQEHRAHPLGDPLQREHGGDLLQPGRDVGEGDVHAGDELQDEDRPDDDGAGRARRGERGVGDAQDRPAEDPEDEHPREGAPARRCRSAWGRRSRTGRRAAGATIWASEVIPTRPTLPRKYATGGIGVLRSRLRVPSSRSVATDRAIVWKLVSRTPAEIMPGRK